MRYVKTNIGTMPIEEYREIMAVQNGFDSYEELRKQGYRLSDDYDTADDTPHENKGGAMDLEIRPATKAERMYTYSQSQQISMQTGCIGHLRADMDTNGEGFFSSWNDFRKDLKTQEFKDEFDGVINALRENGGLLSNRTALSKYCYSTPASDYGDGREFGVRVDTDAYSYLMRLNPCLLYTSRCVIRDSPKNISTFFKKEPIILRPFLQLHGERTNCLSRNLKTEYTDHQVRTLR